MKNFLSTYAHTTRKNYLRFGLGLSDEELKNFEKASKNPTDPRASMVSLGILQYVRQRKITQVKQNLFYRSALREEERAALSPGELADEQRHLNELRANLAEQRGIRTSQQMRQEIERLQDQLDEKLTKLDDLEKKNVQRIQRGYRRLIEEIFEPEQKELHTKVDTWLGQAEARGINAMAIEKVKAFKQELQATDKILKGFKKALNRTDFSEVVE